MEEFGRTSTATFFFAPGQSHPFETFLLPLRHVFYYSKGEHSYYHLNVSQQFEAWLQKSEFALVASFLAYGGSRFFWFLENAPRMLLNLDLLLTFVHTLLACVQEPNKLVLATFETLSCKYTIAALASRSIMFVEFIAVVRFVSNHLLGRRQVHAFGVMAMASLRKFLPKGEFARSCRDFKDTPEWRLAFDKWAKHHEKYADLVRAACGPYKHLWPKYFEPGCLAFADGLEKFLDDDDAADPFMEHAPVNTDLMESTFGVLDYLNKASHGVDIWSNFGQVHAHAHMHIYFYGRINIYISTCMPTHMHARI